MSAHGYGAYTRGCRCDVCRRAKADYMRKRRANAFRIARESGTQRVRPGDPQSWETGAIRFIAPGITHGTASGYEESGCRCFDCTEAASLKRCAEMQRQRDRKAAS